MNLPLKSGHEQCVSMCLSVWGRLLREVCVCVYGRSEVLLR